MGVSSSCGLLWEKSIQPGQIPDYTEIGGKRLASAAATISHGTDLMLDPEPEAKPDIKPKSTQNKRGNSDIISRPRFKVPAQMLE